MKSLFIGHDQISKASRIGLLDHANSFSESTKILLSRAQGMRTLVTSELFEMNE